MRIGLTANMVTWIGAALTSASAILLIPRGSFAAALVATAVIGSADLLDGTMARLQGTASSWGSFLDSTLDRLTDAALIGSIALYFANQSSVEYVAFALVAFAGAQVTSYIRAKAESVGATAKVGFAERSERSIIIYVGLAGAAWVDIVVLQTAIVILAIATLITVAQRLHFVAKQLNN
jgi:phosphatidylglycerophosphate synthase